MLQIALQIVGQKEILGAGREILEALMVKDTIMGCKRNVRGANREEEGNWKGVLRIRWRGGRICWDMKGQGPPSVLELKFFSVERELGALVHNVSLLAGNIRTNLRYRFVERESRNNGRVV